MFPIAEGGDEFMLTAISVMAGFIGIGLSYYMYVVNPRLPENLASGLGGLYTLIYNKYYVDEAYDAAIVSPMISGSRSILWKIFDAGFIDGIVNGVGTQARGIGGWLRQLQSGNIRSYATWVVVGAVGLLIAMGLAHGMDLGAGR
jgi:NADH-quinone oxidoreductase subunit L